MSANKHFVSVMPPIIGNSSVELIIHTDRSEAMGLFLLTTLTHCTREARPIRVYTRPSRDVGGHVRGPSYCGSKFARTLLR